MRDIFKTTILLEFITGMYSFHLLIELLYVPLLVLLAMVDVVAGLYDEHSTVRRPIKGCLVVLGLLAPVYAVLKLLTNLQDIATVANTKALFLVPALSLSLMPFVYLIALCSAYEQVFVRFSYLWVDKDRFLRGYAKWQVVNLCHLSLGRVRHLLHDYGNELHRTRDREDVKKLIRLYREEKDGVKS